MLLAWWGGCKVGRKCFSFCLNSQTSWTTREHTAISVYVCRVIQLFTWGCEHLYREREKDMVSYCFVSIGKSDDSTLEEVVEEMKNFWFVGDASFGLIVEKWSQTDHNWFSRLLNHFSRSFYENLKFGAIPQLLFPKIQEFWVFADFHTLWTVLTRKSAKMSIAPCLVLSLKTTKCTKWSSKFAKLTKFWPLEHHSNRKLLFWRFESLKKVWKIDFCLFSERTCILVILLSCRLRSQQFLDNSICSTTWAID